MLGWLNEMTIEDIRELVSSQVFERGESYFRQGMVLDIRESGDTLRARVKGSGDEVYSVQIKESNGRILATCTCPYDGVCKHVIATLLYAKQQEIKPSSHGAFSEKLESYINNLDISSLKEMLMDFLKRYPEEAEALEMMILAKNDEAEAKKSLRNLLSKTFSRGFVEYRRVYEYVQELKGLIVYGRYLSRVSPELSAWFFEEIYKRSIRRYDQIDDSDGTYALFVDTIGYEWGRVLEKIENLDGEKIAGKILKFILDDKYGLSEELLKDIYPALGKKGAGKLQNWLRECYEQELKALKSNQKSVSLDFHKYKYQLKKLSLLMENLDEYVRLCMDFPLPNDYFDAVKELKRAGRIEEAYRIVCQGEESCKTLELSLLKIKLMKELGHPDTSKYALELFKRTPLLNVYEIYISTIPDEDKEKAKQETIEWLIENRKIPYVVDILLVEKKTETLLELYNKYPEAFRELSYKTLESIAALFENIAPIETADIYYNLALEVLQRAQTRYYHHAIRYLKKAKSNLLKAERADLWDNLKEEIIAKHRRKTTFMRMFHRSIQSGEK